MAVIFHAHQICSNVLLAYLDSLISFSYFIFGATFSLNFVCTNHFQCINVHHYFVYQPLIDYVNDLVDICVKICVLIVNVR